jgi:hypothetical protein
MKQAACLHQPANTLARTVKAERLASRRLAAVALAVRVSMLGGRSVDAGSKTEPLRRLQYPGAWALAYFWIKWRPRENQVGATDADLNVLLRRVTREPRRCQCERPLTAPAWQDPGIRTKPSTINEWSCYFSPCLISPMARPHAGFDEQLVTLSTVACDGIPESAECDEPKSCHDLSRRTVIVTACIVIADEAKTGVGLVRP